MILKHRRQRIWPFRFAASRRHRESGSRWLCPRLSSGWCQHCQRTDQLPPARGRLQSRTAAKDLRQDPGRPAAGIADLRSPLLNQDRATIAGQLNNATCFPSEESAASATPPSITRQFAVVQDGVEATVSARNHLQTDSFVAEERRQPTLRPEMTAAVSPGPSAGSQRRLHLALREVDVGQADRTDVMQNFAQLFGLAVRQG